MNLVKAGKGKTFTPCQLQYRGDEKMWVMSGDNEVSIYFELNFKSKADIALARIFMLTLKDIKAPKVINAQSCSYYDRNFPDRITAAFPSCKSTSATNGIVSFSL